MKSRYVVYIFLILFHFSENFIKANTLSDNWYLEIL